MSDGEVSGSLRDPALELRPEREIGADLEVYTRDASLTGQEPIGCPYYW